MSTKYTGFKLGVLHEDTYATLQRAGTPANTKWYKVFETDFPRPHPKWSINNFRNLSSHDVQDQNYGLSHLTFPITYNFLEGVWAYYWLGEESKSDDTPAAGQYTHTLTGREPSDTNGFLLPSRQFHWQTSGLTTQRIYDILGCVVEQVDMFYRRDKPGLYVTESIRAREINSHNSNTASVAYSTDNLAACNSNISEDDQFHLTEVKHGGSATNIKDDIALVGFRLKHTTTPNHTNRSGTDSYGNAANAHIKNVLYNGRTYTLSLTYRLTDNTWDLEDYLHQKDTSTSLILKFERTTTKAESVTFTFNTSGLINETGGKLPFVADDTFHNLTFQPQDLTSLAIVDVITTTYANSTPEA